MVEVERKYRITNAAAFRRRVRALGARTGKAKLQVDTYYVPLRSAASLRSWFGKQYLRIREHRAGRRVYARLEYHVVKTRYLAREYEVEVGDARTVHQVLLSLGYVPFARVRKVREEWRYGGVEVELDQVRGLGSFVELEVLGTGERTALKKIDALAVKLGLAPEHRSEGMSYFKMIVQREQPAVFRKYYGKS